MAAADVSYMTLGPYILPHLCTQVLFEVMSVMAKTPLGKVVGKTN